MAGKGGGSWKVAYADFVTAMMAFFLVLWICGQDQKIKRSVSYYFQDPFNQSQVGTLKTPSGVGSLTEFNNSDHVPQAESVAVGTGRSSYSPPREKSRATKRVSDWIFQDRDASRYWRDKAVLQREVARTALKGTDQPEAVDEVATRQLAVQLRDEITCGVPFEANSLYSDLLFEGMAEVNWAEVAEDVLSLIDESDSPAAARKAQAPPAAVASPRPTEPTPPSRPHP